MSRQDHVKNNLNFDETTSKFLIKSEAILLLTK